MSTKLEKIVERGVEAQESTVKLVEAMQEHNKQMNDNFILHCATTSDTNKLVKGLLGWVVKVVVVALIVIAGAREALNYFA